MRCTAGLESLAICMESTEAERCSWFSFSIHTSPLARFHTMDANRVESSSAHDDGSDAVLMRDPFLDYLNDLLLQDQGTDDGVFTQPSHPDFQAIFSDFYHVLLSEQHAGQQPPALANLPTESRSFSRSTASDADAELYQCPVEGHCDENLVIGAYPEDHGLDCRLTKEPHIDVDVPQLARSDGDRQTADSRDLTGHKENCNLPPASTNYEESLSRFRDIELMSFEDLKLGTAYKDLYTGERSPLNRISRDPAMAARRRFGRKVSTTNVVQSSEDVREALVKCAEAVAIGDLRTALQGLQQLRQAHGASANGTGLQRAAQAFSDALAARIRGTGEQEYGEMSQNMPPATVLLLASKVGFEVSPFVKILHYFANQNILKVAEGATTLHIVDYGSMYGMQWPCLMNALADRKERPPTLVITAVEFPHPGNDSATKNLNKIGRQLASYAKAFNVPFLYHAVVSDKWEELDATSLHIGQEGDHEVLVVNCMKRLRHLPDESSNPALITISPRQKLLASILRLNPQLFVTTVVPASYNSTFFVSRFREALYYFSNLFDMLDTLWGDTHQRRIMERNCFYRDILNVVACEGAVRVERPEAHRQWHARISKAGFEPVPVPPTIFTRAKAHVKQHYHKEFGIEHDASEWMLLGWKGRSALAVSAWKPARTSDAVKRGRC